LIRIFKNDIELYESQLSIESFIEIEYLVSADNRKKEKIWPKLSQMFALNHIYRYSSCMKPLS